MPEGVDEHAGLGRRADRIASEHGEEVALVRVETLAHPVELRGDCQTAAVEVEHLKPGLIAGQRGTVCRRHRYRAHRINTPLRYPGCQRGGSHQDLRRLLRNGYVPGRRGCRGDPPERFGEAGRLVDLGAGRVQFLLREPHPCSAPGSSPESNAIGT